MGLDLPPIDVILSWPEPNYVDPVRRGPEFFVISSFFFALSTIAVSTRLYARIFIRRWFGIDDAFICLAWVCTLKLGERDTQR